MGERKAGESRITAPVVPGILLAAILLTTASPGIFAATDPFTGVEFSLRMPPALGPGSGKVPARPVGSWVPNQPGLHADAMRELHRGAWLRDAAASDVLAQRVIRGDEMAGRTLHEKPEKDRASRVPPGLAFLMSAALPGTGQLAEGRNRAYVYLGVEAMAWIAHFAWKDAGEKKEGEYEAYARRHWDLEKWKKIASGDSTGCDGALPPGVNYADVLASIEGFLAEGNDQHYYEDIGKLEAYRAGWDDYDCPSPETISPNRGEYRGMRDDSNTFLSHARYGSMVAFLNRVVSAVDAYRTSRGARLSLSTRTSIEVGLRGSMARPGVHLRVRRKL